MKPLEIEAKAAVHLADQLSLSQTDSTISLVRCYFHAVEACVAVKRLEKIDEFHIFVLKATQLLQEPDVEQLNGLLHIGRQIIQQAVLKLVTGGLLSEEKDGCFQITSAGISAISTGQVETTEYKRRLFHFIHNSNEFLQIRDLRGRNLYDLERCETPDNWNFNPQLLEKCITKSDQWKKDRGFPTDVVQVVTKKPTKSEVSSAAEVNNDGQQVNNDITELISEERLLVIDKAQGANCAIVIKFEKDEPAELTAYPISPKGFLQRTEGDCLFSLNGNETILQVFPAVAAVPSSQQLKQAWQTLVETYELADADNAILRTERSCIIVNIDEKLVMKWLNFCWEVIKGQVFCNIRFTQMTRLYKVSIKTTDKNAGELISQITLLYRLNKENQRETILANTENYRNWLSANGFSIEAEIYQLACLAWRLGEFRFAYTLAELEDMADV